MSSENAGRSSISHHLLSQLQQEFHDQITSSGKSLEEDLPFASQSLTTGNKIKTGFYYAKVSCKNTQMPVDSMRFFLYSSGGNVSIRFQLEIICSQQIFSSTNLYRYKEKREENVRSNF